MAGCMFENQETPIKQAIKNEDADALRKSLKNGENVHLTDRKGNTYLHYVCTMHRPVIFHILVGSGINLNVQNRHGNTALHVTALQNECCHVADLLAAGIDPFIKNKDGKTAAEIKTRNIFWINIYNKYKPGIFHAVANHDVDKVICLLQCWSRVDTKRDGQTLRQFTAAHKFHDLVFHIDLHTHTLGAIYAILEGDVEKAWKFLSHPKCNINFLNQAADSTHILQYAIKSKDARIIRMICKANINVNVTVRVNKFLKAPLYFVAIDSLCPDDIMWTVLKSKADFRLRDERGRNAGVYALDKTKGRISSDVIEYMLKQGLDVSQRDCTGVTLRDVSRLARRRDIVTIMDKAYVKTIRSSDIEELERLAVMGYDSLLIDFNYRDTYIYASGNETVEAVDFVKWLPKFNEDVRTFLYSVQHSSVDQVCNILKSSDRPDLLINARDKGGRTCLHIAVLHTRVDVLQFLLTCPHCDVNATDNMGRTAYHYASCVEKVSRTEICQLLESMASLNAELEDFNNHKASFNILHPQQAAEWIDKERKIIYGMSKQLVCADKYEELCLIIKHKRKHLMHFENSICKFQYPVAQFSKILKPVLNNYRDLLFLAMERRKEPIAVRLVQLGTDLTITELCEVKKSNESDGTELVLMSVSERAAQLGMDLVLRAIEKKKNYSRKTQKMKDVSNKKMFCIRTTTDKPENLMSDSVSDSMEMEFLMESDEEQEESCNFSVNNDDCERSPNDEFEEESFTFNQIYENKKII
uniref:Uncharacterized protein n=1 Tax=Biomphalaria glabrata TaxID=6526 RepID=A0A2C9KP86_BIOGL